MECWITPDERVIPVLEGSNCPVRIVSCSMRHAVRALFSRPGATEWKNDPHRVPGSKHRFRHGSAR